MKTLNSAQVRGLFEAEAILIASQDAVPLYRAMEIFGKTAVEHATRMALASQRPGTYYNHFGACTDYSLEYLTREGFLVAASYRNVEIARETERKSALEEEHV